MKTRKIPRARKNRPNELVDWRKRLYQKTFEMVAWDWKQDPRPNIRALCRTFKLRPSLKHLDPEYPERLLATVASRYRLHLYDVPSLEGSDAYGFILSRETLTKREIQQIEADYWGEDFDEVYR